MGGNGKRKFSPALVIAKRPMVQFQLKMGGVLETEYKAFVLRLKKGPRLGGQWGIHQRQESLKKEDRANGNPDECFGGVGCGGLNTKPGSKGGTGTTGKEVEDMVDNVEELVTKTQSTTKKKGGD